MCYQIPQLRSGFRLFASYRILRKNESDLFVPGQSHTMLTSLLLMTLHVIIQKARVQSDSLEMHRTRKHFVRGRNHHLLLLHCPYLPHQRVRHSLQIPPVDQVRRYSKDKADDSAAAAAAASSHSIGDDKSEDNTAFCQR